MYMMMLSSCGAKFTPWKQITSNWSLQRPRETKNVHIVKIYSSPIYMRTLMSENKLLEKRPRSPFFVSSNCTSPNFQLRSNNLSVNQVSQDPDIEPLEAWLKVSYVVLMAVGVVMLRSTFGLSFKQSIGCSVIIGLSLAFAFRRSFGYVLGAPNLFSARPCVKEEGTIKAGTIEEQLIELGVSPTLFSNEAGTVEEQFAKMGLPPTFLLELSGTFPMSLFSSEDIMNKTKDQGCVITNKLRIQIYNKRKVTPMFEAIQSMLQSHPKVLSGTVAPFCFIYLVDATFGDLTFGCLVEKMKKDELIAVEFEILLQVVRICRKHKAELYSSLFA